MGGGITVIWYMNIYRDIFSKESILQTSKLEVWAVCLPMVVLFWNHIFIFKLSGEKPQPNGIRGSVWAVNTEYFLSDNSRQTSASLIPHVLEQVDDCCVWCIITCLAHSCSLTWPFSLPVFLHPLGVAFAPGGTEWSNEKRLRIQGAGLPCTDLLSGKCHIFSPPASFCRLYCVRFSDVASEYFDMTLYCSVFSVCSQNDAVCDTATSSFSEKKRSKGRKRSLLGKQSSLQLVCCMKLLFVGGTVHWQIQLRVNACVWSFFWSQHSSSFHDSSWHFKHPSYQFMPNINGNHCDVCLFRALYVSLLTFLRY